MVLFDSDTRQFTSFLDPAAWSTCFQLATAACILESSVWEDGGAEGRSREGAHDLQELQDAVKPAAAKSALFPVTSFLDGLALSPPPPPRQRWSTPGPRGSIASRSGPGELVSFFRRRLFRSPRCEAESPSGFMAGICQINHTTDQRRTKRRPLGKATPLPHPIRALGTRAKFRLAGQPPLLASSVIDVFRRTPFFFSFSFRKPRISAFDNFSWELGRMESHHNLSLSLQPGYMAPLGIAPTPMSKLTSANSRSHGSEPSPPRE